MKPPRSPIQIGHIAAVLAPDARPAPPASRVTLKKGNRRRTTPLWSRLPRPRALADACGRALRRSVPALLALVGIGVVAGGGYAGYRFITSSPRFAIERIE